MEMIFLHSQENKLSRELLEEHQEEFSQILEYPSCLADFPAIAKFPAVAVLVPERQKDNSLYATIMRLYPDEHIRKRMGINVGEMYNLTHANYPTQCIQTMDMYMTKFKETDYGYLVEVANDTSVPAFNVMGVLPHIYLLDEEYGEDLHEQTKTRSVKTLDESQELTETIPEHYEIVYPEDYATFEDATEELTKRYNKYTNF